MQATAASGASKTGLPKTFPLPSPLPESEVQIFDFVLEAVKGLDVTLRVAGGWVRDKMLGRASDDIDITIETPEGRPYISGEKLANVIADYTEKQSSSHQHPHVSTIKTNPEKSKHIETAQVTIFGQQLEFCHLRKDDYTSCSPVQRTPTVKVATPLEDAQRRDFCCNALFYNIHTKNVEDFVGGVHDLKDGILRCPLDPYETFTDDPLRMLRGVRFAGKLKFRIDSSIEECIKGSGAPEHEPLFTHESKGIPLRPLVWELLRKVSRERYGIEVGKMFRGPFPLYCTELLSKLDLLYSAVLVEYHPVRFSKTKLAAAEFERIMMIVPPDEWVRCFSQTVPLTKVALQEENQKQQNQQQQEEDALSSIFASKDDQLVVTLFSLLIVPLLQYPTADSYSSYGDISTPASSSSSVTSTPNVSGANKNFGVIKTTKPTPASSTSNQQNQNQSQDQEAYLKESPATTKEGETGGGGGGGDGFAKPFERVSSSGSNLSSYASTSSNSGLFASPASVGSGTGNFSEKQGFNPILSQWTLSPRYFLVMRRTEAILQYGIKLPSNIAKEVGTLLAALDLIISDPTCAQQLEQLLSDSENSSSSPTSSSSSSSSASHEITGELRNSLFHSLRQLSKSSDIVVESWLRVLGGIIFDCKEDKICAFIRLVKKDAALVGAGKLQPALKGDDVVKLVPDLPRNSLTSVLTAELLFMVNNNIGTNTNTSSVSAENSSNISSEQLEKITAYVQKIAAQVIEGYASFSSPAVIRQKKQAVNAAVNKTQAKKQWEKKKEEGGGGGGGGTTGGDVKED